MLKGDLAVDMDLAYINILYALKVAFISHSTFVIQSLSTIMSLQF